MPLIQLVVARAENGVIGRDGGLPWRIPADLRHFKAKTLGTPMIMGRRTFESLPGLLPERRHIVLTRDQQWNADGAEAVATVNEALEQTSGAPLVSVVGGAEIFALFLPRADRIELTEVHARPAGDTIMPAPDPTGWREENRFRHEGEGGGPAFSFVTLARR